MTSLSAGFFDIGSCGAPVMIFGAKKLKNGSALIITSSQAESKDREWKDKDAVGKITRSGPGYTYMGRLYTDKIQDKDKNTTYSQDVLQSNETAADHSNSQVNQALGLQKSSSDRSISMHGAGVGVRTMSGPLAVSVSSSVSDKLIQASVIVADTSIIDRFIEGERASE